jgi:hypothetical protein
MTTFNHGGCSLRKATALVTAAILCGSVVQAHSAQSPSPGLVQGGKPKCAPLLDPASDTNRYVLLLFFRKDADQDAIQKAFGQDKPDEPGCIPDPDPGAVGARKIVVQGSCPTDCSHTASTREGYQPGDPLSRVTPKLRTLSTFYGNKAVWGIFFADPAGAAEAENSDKDTTLRVWQILAKDSCHAGNILNSLEHSAPGVFSKDGGYLGQIMIGYSPRWKSKGPHSAKPCKPWSSS